MAKLVEIMLLVHVASNVASTQLGLGENEQCCRYLCQWKVGGVNALSDVINVFVNVNVVQNSWVCKGCVFLGK